jgi:RNA polymerase sigma-70 factor (ECF subfamily)
MMTLSRDAREAEPVTGAAEAPCEDAAWVRATLAGDAGAFDQIVRAYSARLYNYVYQMTRQRQDAEDLVQQTFIKAYHHLDRFDLSRPLINWLITIARRTTLNHFRDTKRWEEMPHDAASHEPSPAHQAEQRDRAENLWDRARAVLAPRDFEILWLRFAEELSITETAQVVGLTETHVKVLVFRARQTLLKGEKRP